MGKDEVLEIGYEKIDINLLIAGNSPAESVDQLSDSQRDAIILHLGETKQKLREIIEQQKENKMIMVCREDLPDGDSVQFNGSFWVEKLENFVTFLDDFPG